MSLIFTEIKEIKDDELFVITGKDLKAINEIAENARTGPTNKEYYIAAGMRAMFAGMCVALKLFKKE